MLARLLAAFFIVSSFAIATAFSWHICFWCLLARGFLWAYLFTTTESLGLTVLLGALLAATVAFYQSIFPHESLCPIGPLLPWVQCEGLGEQPLLWGHSISLTTLAWFAIVLLILTHLWESSVQKKTSRP